MDKDSYQDDKHDTPDGVYPISLGENARNRLKCVINWDISEIEPIRVCSINIILEEAREYPDSDLGKLYTNIQMCKLDEIFVVYDKFRQYGYEFLICLTDQAKYTFKCIEENKNMGLVNRSKDYVYQPPTPRKWENFGSEKEIEQDWVGDTRPKICILVKRSKRRYVNREFEDRDVNDATDGYVGCDAYNDTIKWGSVHSMERGMQAVPVLVDNSAQTELKYPKNTYCQYESRVFSEEQIKEHMESDEMKQFMNKVSNIINEIQKDPDIMGRFRNDITKFYKRDEVEHVEQTEMIEIMAFSDLTFTNKMKVNHIRWHPIIEGIVAMSVMDDNNFSDYLKTSSERTIVPNFLLIWSEAHPIFPQLLLRIPDDITKFEWHPNEPDIIIGGTFNGQVVIWDIGPYLLKLKNKTCIWRYDIVLTDSGRGDKLYVKDGFIPVINWSAESMMGASHSFMIEDLKWFPADVRFHSDSAYPRKNDDESVRQFLTCSSGDAFILVWGFEIPPSDNTGIDSLAPDIGQPDGLQSQGILHQSSNWNKVKEHHGFMDYNSESSSNTKKVGVGKYQFLNEIWKPVHKISFLLPQSEKITDEIQYFRVQITSVSVISRPDLMLKSEKQQKKSTGDDESDLSDVDDEDMGDNSRSNRKSRRSMDHNFFAIPIDFIGGTFLGSIFKADLSKVKVEVESGELQCKIKWNRSTHDGPTKCIERSPFNSDVILTMGGYSLAIWKDNVIEKPVILHFVDYEEEFTQAVWSLTRPAVYFLSGNLGNFQAWLIMSRQSAPFFKENISGKSITSLCPYEIQTSRKHLMTIGDSTGTLRILSLPRELWETESNEIEEFEKYITREIELVREKDRKISENSFESMITSSRKKNQQQDEEEEASYSAWSDVNKFWSDYFEVEKGYLLDKYGQISWTSHANKNPRYPRSQYLSEFEDTDVIDKKTVKVASSALDAFKKTAAK